MEPYAVFLFLYIHRHSFLRDSHAKTPMISNKFQWVTLLLLLFMEMFPFGNQYHSIPGVQSVPDYCP